MELSNMVSGKQPIPQRWQDEGACCQLLEMRDAHAKSVSEGKYYQLH